MELQYKIFGAAVLIVVLLIIILVRPYITEKRSGQKMVRIPMFHEKEKYYQLNEWIAPLGFAYDKRQNIFYSRTDAWQCKCGYGEFYDENAVSVHMIIDSEPIYFEYGGREWLIELFKGQYMLATGGEVGVYCKEPDNDREFYLCAEDEDTLKIKMALWKNEHLLFHRKGYHWWLTGFALGEFSKLKELTMDVEITLHDEQMRDAFVESLLKIGYQIDELTIVDNAVSFLFDRPRTKQIKARDGFISGWKQIENKYRCNVYRKVTKKYEHSYDKLIVLKEHKPDLFYSFLGNGKGMLLFQERFDE